LPSPFNQNPLQVQDYMKINNFIMLYFVDERNLNNYREKRKNIAFKIELKTRENSDEFTGTLRIEVGGDDLRCIEHCLRVGSDEEDEMAFVVDREVDLAAGE
jgi:hypothetical protein